ncbi:hypothetical protein [Negadavirga shengliensis]|uniref:Acetyltransferase (GNAT) domain-containing protein n=1 Tax=Negadavirga shengliensis TaxID=1389218 RepID=A0ABV9T4E6_9BACT
MTIFTVQRYHSGLEDQWESVLERSINGTFMHSRKFISYHGDRFEDFSLLIYRGGDLVALLPAEKEGKKVFSHRGLTYAGWIVAPGLDEADSEGMIGATLAYLGSHKLETLMIKSVPEFYYTTFSQALSRAFQRQNPEVLKTQKHYTTSLPFRIKDRGKLWGRKKAIAHGLRVGRSDDFKVFWENILIPNLQERHATRPVHKLEEIMLLRERFPENIQLYLVFDREGAVGGSVLFVTPEVAHTQYIASTPAGRNMRALDLLMTTLLEETFSEKKYFSMGISDEPDTGLPNEGLVKWKESLGAKTYGQWFYEFDLNPGPL